MSARAPSSSSIASRKITTLEKKWKQILPNTSNDLISKWLGPNFMFEAIFPPTSEDLENFIAEVCEDCCDSDTDSSGSDSVFDSDDVMTPTAPSSSSLDIEGTVSSPGIVSAKYPPFEATKQLLAKQSSINISPTTSIVSNITSPRMWNDDSDHAMWKEDPQVHTENLPEPEKPVVAVAVTDSAIFAVPDIPAAVAPAVTAANMITEPVLIPVAEHTIEPSVSPPHQERKTVTQIRKFIRAHGGKIKAHATIEELEKMVTEIEQRLADSTM